MTNFERIKNMTMDQLINSDLLSCKCCICYRNKDKCPSYLCENGMKEWLNQEIKLIVKRERPTFKIKKIKKR